MSLSHYIFRSSLDGYKAPRVALKDVRNQAPSAYRSIPIEHQPAMRRRQTPTLVPLHVAAMRPDIKYREEGFEMKEAILKLQMRARPVEEFDEELTLRCFC